MASCSAVCARLATRVAAASAAVVLSVTAGAGVEQGATSPRLREARLPAQVPEAFGGGEVVLELTVDPRGTVTRVDRVRVTPPYADLVAGSAAEWRFEPARAVIEGRLTAVAAPVLVVGLFRPPSFYAGPAPGIAPQTVGEPSAVLPRMQSAVMPAYPPTVSGNAIVLVEIEMTSRAEPRTWRVASPSSGFDAAALDAVRAAAAAAWTRPPPPTLSALVGEPRGRVGSLQIGSCLTQGGGTRNAAYEVVIGLSVEAQHSRSP